MVEMIETEQKQKINLPFSIIALYDVFAKFCTEKRELVKLCSIGANRLIKKVSEKSTE